VSTQQLFLSVFGGLLPLCLIAYHMGRRKIARSGTDTRDLRSRPHFYGWYALLWLALPALGVSATGAMLHILGLAEVPGTMLLATALAAAGFGLWWAMRRINPSMAAQRRVEGVVRTVLFLASLVSILTTLGIVVSVIVEAWRFFTEVSLFDFLTGTTWSPETAFLGGAGREAETMAKPEFGSVPIFAGTFMITAIAMCVAVPIGLLSAIYMAEYAPLRFRQAAKPLLEVLAGIPTVVYGFFAAITVAPAVVRAAEVVGLEADYTNALASGLVMGIMIIPFVSSLSDDVINAVPQSVREGSYALGMTSSETIKNVVVPAAMPGIISAFLLAVSKALGETMIVVMAAGLRPNLTANPLEGMTTVTVRIVDALTGDQAFDSLETLSAFGLSLVLLVFTLTLNLIATIVVRRFRRSYE
jgi:phosphate transport system permease protein